MTAEQQTCPRRMAEYGPWGREPDLDTWIADRVGPSCSFCGSLHQDRFMELIREGWIVGPTDKNYKAYLSRPFTDEEKAGRPSDAIAEGEQVAKFYYLHLSDAQRDEFIELYNAGGMKVGYPGGFYQPPFFAQPRA